MTSVCRYVIGQPARMVGAGKVWKGFIFFILSARPSPEMVKKGGPILLVKISYKVVVDESSLYVIIVIRVRVMWKLKKSALSFLLVF